MLKIDSNKIYLYYSWKGNKWNVKKIYSFCKLGFLEFNIVVIGEYINKYYK